MNLHVLQHVSCEGPGMIADWAVKNHHGMRLYSVFQDEITWPELEDDDALIVMGGPMNIYEENDYPWLSDEKAVIREAVSAGRKVLGICLGAQMIADVIGGKVVKNDHTEIGWFPIRWTPQALNMAVFAHSSREMPAFHWHGDRFELPSGTESLAESEACKYQAFRYEKHVIGFQFHAEMHREDARRLIENSRDELKPGAYIQTEQQMLADPQGFAHANRWMEQFLDRFLG